MTSKQSKKDTSVLTAAAEFAATAPKWADLSNFLFNPEDGLVTRAFPTRSERQAFMKTETYKALRGLLESAMVQSGLIEGAQPQKSGKFVVRLPKTLHAALEREAEQEGVSLNQLVVTKLAVQLSQMVK
jgi:predicted HicB family RNase H-like nuclease